MAATDMMMGRFSSIQGTVWSWTSRCISGCIFLQAMGAVYFASRYGRGTSLRPLISSPVYACRDYEKVPLVDAAAVRASFGTPAVPQVFGRDVRLSGWRQRGTRFSFAVSAPDGAVVRLPLFFYPGYAARNEAGREVAVREGRDHLVEVVLPPGGTVVFGRYAGRPGFLWLDVLAVASWGAFAWGCWRRRRAGGSQGAF